MKGIMQKITGNKYFHLCVILLIIAGILTVLEIMMFNYKMQGETNMPFELSKITVISSQEGISKENAEYKSYWIVRRR